MIQCIDIYIYKHKQWLFTSLFNVLVLEGLSGGTFFQKSAVHNHISLISSRLLKGGHRR